MPRTTLSETFDSMEPRGTEDASAVSDGPPAREDGSGDAAVEGASGVMFSQDELVLFESAGTRERVGAAAAVSTFSPRAVCSTLAFLERVVSGTLSAGAADCVEVPGAAAEGL